MIKKGYMQILFALFYLIHRIVKYLILRKVKGKQCACFGSFYFLKTCQTANRKRLFHRQQVRHFKSSGFKVDYSRVGFFLSLPLSLLCFGFCFAIRIASRFIFALSKKQVFSRFGAFFFASIADLFNSSVRVFSLSSLVSSSSC